MKVEKLCISVTVGSSVAGLWFNPRLCSCMEVGHKEWKHYMGVCFTTLLVDKLYNTEQ
jgi:hypothetical protein